MEKVGLRLSLVPTKFVSTFFCEENIVPYSIDILLKIIACLSNLIKKGFAP